METTDTALCSLICSELADVGCELVDLEVRKIRGITSVKVYVDRRGGVTLEMIERATGKIKDGLDRTDLLGMDYALEVSSPGEKRSLRGSANLEGFLGRSVMVYLKDGGKRAGTILAADSNLLTLVTEEKERLGVDRDDIEDLHLLYSCNE